MTTMERIAERLADDHADMGAVLDAIAQMVHNRAASRSEANDSNGARSLAACAEFIETAARHWRRAHAE